MRPELDELARGQPVVSRVLELPHELRSDSLRPQLDELARGQARVQSSPLSGTPATTTANTNADPNAATATCGNPANAVIASATESAASQNQRTPARSSTTHSQISGSQIAPCIAPACCAWDAKKQPSSYTVPEIHAAADSTPRRRSSANVNTPPRATCNTTAIARSRGT